MPSHAEWVYQPGSPAAPKDPTGWKPVQLVPENANEGLRRFSASGARQFQSGDVDRDLH